MKLTCVTGIGNDKLIGNAHSGPLVLAGECALQRAGLTTYLSDFVQAWSIYVDIPSVRDGIIQWYFSPFALDTFDTVPSSIHPNILEPTQERALIEYIIFKDYFNEGILIEGLKTYGFAFGNNFEELFQEAKKFHLQAEYVTYWINEALNEPDDP